MIRLLQEDTTKAPPQQAGATLPAVMSLLVHVAVGSGLLWIERSPARPLQAQTAGPLYAEIVIDHKRYVVTPVMPPAPILAPRLERATAEQARGSATASSAKPPAPGRPAPATVKPDPNRLNTLLQADLLTPPVPVGEDLPSFQVVTGRLAPYRRQFVMPGARPKPAARSVDLDPLPLARSPQPATVTEFATSAKLVLPPPPTVVDETLPPADQPNPALEPGDPLNAVSTNLRVISAPEHLLLPPNQFVARSGAPEGKASESAAAGATNAGASPAVGLTKAPSPERPAESAAVRGPAEPVVIQRSPQGKFDSIVVQSSPLEQFPGGSALLHGRPIFTVYVPMGVGKDWPMFFCAQATAPTDSANQAIEPPYPFKLLLPKISIPSYQKYVLVRGIVTEDGSVRDVKVIAPAKQETAALLVEALMQWTFRPATRQGTAIPVEFVIAVPAATY